MSRTWLLLDVSGLAYRSMHTLGDLSHEGIATGAIYGMFRAVLEMMEVYATNNLVWCFDRGYDCRLAVCPTYKANRKTDDDPEKREARRIMRQQLYRLRTDYLPAMGFRNVLSQEGFEADDVLASVCGNLPGKDRAIIVSSDHDLFQLLSPRVSMLSPSSKSIVTADSFRAEWGIGPDQWMDVLAMAGCDGDNVVGLDGIGYKTAVKFLTGNLKDSTKAFRHIVSNNGMWRHNLELVRLPFTGTKRFELVEDGVIDWDGMFHRLGMASLRGKGRIRG